MWDASFVFLPPLLGLPKQWVGKRQSFSQDLRSSGDAIISRGMSLNVNKVMLLLPLGTRGTVDLPHGWKTEGSKSSWLGPSSYCVSISLVSVALESLAN